MRSHRITGLRLDAAIAVLAAGYGITDMVVGVRTDQRVAQVMLVGAAALALGFVRRAPFRVLLTECALAAGAELSVPPAANLPSLSVAVALGVVAYRHRWPSTVAAWLLVYVLSLVNIARTTSAMLLTGSQGVVRIVVIGVFLAAPVAFARYLRGVRQATVAAEERVRDAERRRLAETRAARLAERARLARDLHDIVAHHVSAIAVHAGTAQFAAVHAGDPASGRDEAVRALDGIRHTAGRALAELHDLLRALREADAPAADAAGGIGGGGGPTLEPEAMIVDAVARGRASGLDIDARIDDRCAQAPLAVRVTAARVVQEALTNALKHAGPGAAVHTRVDVDGAVLRVEVADSGPVGARPALPVSGYGLTGMRERVGVLGGALTAGPTGCGGWRLSMRLPLRADA